MSVTVSFVDPVSPATLTAIRTMIEAIPAKSDDDHWDVRIRAGDPGCALEITGPQHHHREYLIFGDQSYDPVYVAALVRTEINSFPSAPPQDVAFALAELPRLGVPYDDSEIFSGRIVVDAREFTTQTLANLYRNEQLSTRFRRPH